ncbi:TolC family protein [Fundidesulfovibrio putealis]|uniref:TolC family protein n=1 Tax=Fundidesulfovibrio putealis TaxID=270496 RepID=UPI00041FE0F6|nr:TolC family protein [Fundidesulfovibrio putealis]
MHRTFGPHKHRRAAAALAVLLCFLLAFAGAAMAQQKTQADAKSTKTKQVQTAQASGEVYTKPAAKPGEIRQYQAEVLPSAPVTQAAQPGTPVTNDTSDTVSAKKPAADKNAAKGDTQAKAQAPAQTDGATPPPGAMREMSTTIKQPADFNEAVRVALVQSPMLVKSALEIETKRLDVQDAWSSFVPTVAINTTYWFRMPTKTDGTTDKPYTISFSSGQWNPLLSGFEVQARKEMTNIAILGHLKVIAEGLKRLASDFLQLSAIAEQKEMVKKRQDLAKQNLDFFKARLGLGQATQLDIRIAETRIQMAKAEDDKINAMRAMVMDDIKFLLGVPFTNKLELDVAAAKQQILGKFSPADVTDEKVRAYSFDLRMQEYEKSLQKKNIGLSYVKLLPSFGFTFQTVDAFNNTSSNAQNNGFPFYPGINISMPLDYWTKGREISRQYKKLDQLQAAAKAKEFEVIVLVQKAMSEYQTTSSDLLLASSKADLAKLQDEQAEYRYKTGQLDFDKLVTDRNAFYDAKQQQLLQQVKRDIALLSLKHLSGDLQGQYIDVAAWEK